MSKSAALVGVGSVLVVATGDVEALPADRGDGYELIELVCVASGESL